MLRLAPVLVSMALRAFEHVPSRDPQHAALQAIFGFSMRGVARGRVARLEIKPAEVVTGAESGSVINGGKPKARAEGPERADKRSP
jgi:hypothetical protein